MDSRHDAPTEPQTRGPRFPSGNSNSQAQPQTIIKRRGNPLLSFLLFLLGIMLGILATLFYILFGAHDRASIQTTSSTQPSSLTVQISSTYLTQLVSRKLKTSGIPGDISNVQVTLANDNSIQVTGQDRFSLFVISVTRPFTVTLQAYTQSCQPRIRLIHADFSDIPVTNFAQSYETQIDQEIQFKTSDLPEGFTYCAVSTHTQANALSIVYSATPS